MRTDDIWNLTAEGKTIAESNSPEYRVWEAIVSAESGLGLDELKAKLGDDNVFNIGKAKAMKNKWIAMDKATKKLSAKVG